MKEIFAEIGFGNATFLSTEVEEGKKESRVSGFKIPAKIMGVYFRLWIFKKTLIISTLNGVELVKKKKNKFKLLFGVRGVDR